MPPAARQIRLVALLAALLGFGVWSAIDQVRPVIAQEPEAQPGEGPAPFAVVELYTSEGCSSCPPADALLAGISAEAEQSGARVFTLAFHVDYWDRLGWPDPFGQRAFSVRQRRYQRAHGERNAYTPEMLVNGAPGFVGSRRSQARKEIAAALQRTVTVQLAAEAQRESAQLIVTADVTGAGEGAQVLAALVQAEAVIDVARGENAGRTLTHRNVVRQLASAPAGDTGAVLTLPWPEGLEREGAHVIVFVQEADLRITGATRVELR